MRKFIHHSGPLHRDRLPENRIILSWNFPIIIPAQEGREFHEEIEAFGCTDSLYFSAGRRGHSGFRGVPQGGNIGRHILHLAQEVRQLDDENNRLVKRINDLSLNKACLRNLSDRYLALLLQVEAW